MRINLVRAFFNCKIIVVNSDLTSLDIKMRQKVAEGIKFLVNRYQYKVFIRTIEGVCINRLSTTPYLSFKSNE